MTNRILDNAIYYGAEAHTLKKAGELRKEMTGAEKILWRKLKNKQMLGFKFRWQHAINQFIADFYCHKAKLVIEVDGGYHNVYEQKEYDTERTEILSNFGVNVLRFTNEEVEKNIDKVINTIKDNLKWELPAQPH